jgi:hypothetical protein
MHLNDVDVCDGKDPAPVIAVWVVKYVQLAGMQSAHVGFVTQRAVDGLGECLALVQEGTRQGPARTCRSAYLQNHYPDVGIQRQQRGVDGN